MDFIETQLLLPDKSKSYFVGEGVFIINYVLLPAKFFISHISIGKGVGGFEVIVYLFHFLHSLYSKQIPGGWYPPVRSRLGTGASSEAQLSSQRVKLTTPERTSGGGYGRECPLPKGGGVVGLLRKKN